MRGEIGENEIMYDPYKDHLITVTTEDPVTDSDSDPETEEEDERREMEAFSGPVRAPPGHVNGPRD